jgi:hypothetical protein
MGAVGEHNSGLNVEERMGEHRERCEVEKGQVLNKTIEVPRTQLNAGGKSH